MIPNRAARVILILGLTVVVLFVITELIYIFLGVDLRLSQPAFWQSFYRTAYLSVEGLYIGAITIWVTIGALLGLAFLLIMNRLGKLFPGTNLNDPTTLDTLKETIYDFFRWTAQTGKVEGVQLDENATGGGTDPFTREKPI